MNAIHRIQIRRGTPEEIEKVLCQYVTEIAVADGEESFEYTIHPAEEGVVIDITPSISDYLFCNTLCWLDQPPDREESIGDALGWYPIEGEPVLVGRDPAHEMGDTFRGISESGRAYSIYLPEMTITPLDTPGQEYFPPPDLKNPATSKRRLTLPVPGSKRSGCLVALLALLPLLF